MPKNGQQRFREAGMDGYVAKPLQIDKMLETIDPVVAKRRAER